jgi:hypothetical protein
MPCYSQSEDSNNISALTDVYKFNFGNILATIFLGILFDINDDHFRKRIVYRYDLTLQSKNIHIK